MGVWAEMKPLTRAEIEAVASRIGDSIEGQYRVNPKDMWNVLETVRLLYEVKEAASGLISESDNPVPDLSLKAKYRKELRKALRPFEIEERR